MILQILGISKIAPKHAQSTLCRLCPHLSIITHTVVPPAHWSYCKEALGKGHKSYRWFILATKIQPNYSLMLNIKGADCVLSGWFHKFHKVSYENDLNGSKAELRLTSLVVAEYRGCRDPFGFVVIVVILLHNTFLNRTGKNCNLTFPDWLWQNNLRTFVHVRLQILPGFKLCISVQTHRRWTT